jgi:hypothetical protein
MPVELINVAPGLTNLVPSIVVAVLILVVGWIVAALLAALTRNLLRRTGLDARLRGALGGAATAPEVAGGVANAVFYLVLLFVVIAALQTLQLTVVTEPLNAFLTVILAYLPRAAGAALLLLVAWLLATVLRALTVRVLQAVRLEERLGQAPPAADAAPAAPAGGPSVTRTLGEVVYWLVFLLFLPGILSSLGVEGMLAPLLVMLNRLLGFLPNLLAAGVILVVGWFVARLVQRIVAGLLGALGVDALAERVGLGAALGNQRLSALLALIVYVLLLIPVLLAALDALQLEALTLPVRNMLNNILAALPNIFAAVLLLAIAYVGGRLAGGLVTNLVAAAGFDSLPRRLGLAAPAAAPGAPQRVGGRTPSEVVGGLVLAAVLVFAAVEASRLLGFGLLAALLAEFLVFAGRILVGLVIFAIALWLAELAAGVVRASAVPQPRLLALTTRVAVLLLGGAMALRQMGLANEIITVAFGLLLGAVAVAVALAFGLGGREVAAQEVREWRDAIRSGEAERMAPEAGPPPAVSGPGV